VLLHPFPLDASSWDPVRAALGWEGPVIAPNFPGFGGSPAEPAPTIEGFADAVAGLIAADGGPAIVVGLSMGGYQALSLASRHPALVAALGLACTRAEADGATASAGRDRGIAAIRSGGPAGFLEDLLSRALAPGAPPHTAALAREIAGRQPAAALTAALAALRDRPDFTGDLAGIGVPALVIAGAEDAIIPRDTSRALASSLPRGRLAVLEGAGHLAATEQPAAFAALVRELASEVRG
jgi:pimeloyl-ACP methyl ester carboxylesterase